MNATIHPLLPVVLLGLGGGLILLGIAANRYHSRRLKEHTDRLQALDDTSKGRIAASREVKQFYEDRRVEAAAQMVVAEPIGYLLVSVGAVLLYVTF